MVTKKKTRLSTIIPLESIETKILFIRNKKVMLDRDLASLYGVTTGNFNKAIKRNIDRFPSDFMFHLTREEFTNLIFQIGRSSWGGTRSLPYVFTEQGVAMLSGVLKSRRAVRVNIQIMRVFIKMREMIFSYKELQEKIEAIEQKYDYQFKVVFDVIKELLEPPIKPKKPIGFHVHEN